MLNVSDEELLSCPLELQFSSFFALMPAIACVGNVLGFAMSSSNMWKCGQCWGETLPSRKLLEPLQERSKAYANITLLDHHLRSNIWVIIWSNEIEIISVEFLSLLSEWAEDFNVEGTVTRLEYCASTIWLHMGFHHSHRRSVSPL